MRVLQLLPLALAAAALVVIGLVGCEPISDPASPETADLVKPKSADRVPPAPPGNAHHARPQLPIRGTFKGFEPVWVVSHFQEGGLVAGAEVKSVGNVSHLGLTQVRASAAWDWGQPAAGAFTPEGPVTQFSATILPGSTHFTSQDVTATGEVTMTAANGDELHGIITGGEVYELAFAQAGDGQEQFQQVRVEGGTGRFAKAEGQLVLHSIFDLKSMKIVQSSIMRGGWIRY